MVPRLGYAWLPTLTLVVDPDWWITFAETPREIICFPCVPYGLWATLTCHQMARASGTAAAAAAASPMTPKPPRA